MLQREKHRKKEKIQRQRNRNYSMTTTGNNYLTILQDQESHEVEPTVNESSFIDEERVDT